MCQKSSCLLQLYLDGPRINSLFLYDNKSKNKINLKSKIFKKVDFNKKISKLRKHKKML